jgi:hypothetical protein
VAAKEAARPARGVAVVVTAVRLAERPGVVTVGMGPLEALVAVVAAA